MIHIFNRKELCIVFSIKEQGNIRAILSQNNIDYRIKTINRIASSAFSSSSRSRTGSFGVDVNQSYEYKFYVHKKDYENAVYLIRKQS